MTGTGGAESPAPPGGFSPAVYDELNRLAAARLAGMGPFTDDARPSSFASSSTCSRIIAVRNSRR
jgi:hypothetical protein